MTEPLSLLSKKRGHTTTRNSLKITRFQPHSPTTLIKQICYKYCGHENYKIKIQNFVKIC